MGWITEEIQLILGKGRSGCQLKSLQALRAAFPMITEALYYWG
jgi:hypothetical protein